MDQTLDSYLDYNATAPLQEAARMAMVEALDHLGNPSSVHRVGRHVRHAIEAARGAIAGHLGAVPAEMIFTCGGSEANALALSQAPMDRTLAGATEHPSVLAHTDPALRIPVDGDGVVKLDWLEQRLARGGISLVSVMAANNETGAIQPIDAVIRLAHDHGAKAHVDAVQALSKIPLDFAALGADFMSLSAHKIGGPPGIGALLVRRGIDVVPMLKGGGQEQNRRAGTENHVAIAGFAAALDGMARRPGWTERCARLRADLEARMRQVAPDMVVFSQAVPRLCNTSCVAVEGLSAETQLMALDLAGVYVSAGSACSSGKVAPSHVLQAMNVQPSLAKAAIRISLGWHSSVSDIERLAEAWAAHVRHVSHRKQG